MTGFCRVYIDISAHQRLRLIWKYMNYNMYHKRFGIQE